MAHIVSRYPGRNIEVKGRPYLYFGGTAYLGVQADPVFQKILIGNIKKYGTNYGASRNSNIQLSIYEEAEKRLARWIGSEASLTLSSGYLAGQLLCSSFQSSRYKLFYAPNSHSALRTLNSGKAKIKPHVTYSALNFALREHLRLRPKISPVVFLDSIDFSGYSYPHFEGLSTLPLEEIILVADDSHGIGVVGSSGNGSFKKLKELNAKELILCCSLGKAMGIQAGAICGSKERLSQMASTVFFEGASPAPPAYMATFLDSFDYYAEKRKILKQHIKTFLKESASLADFRSIEGHPAFAYADEKLTRNLEENGIIVTDFNYGNDNENLTSRVVLNAAHQKEDIQYLVSVLKSRTKG
ncbi:aminotransferase class I/II-fold pyridoxal phosphate-dependent enzyme [Poritiphilus flavus]|uniref:Aminotransferase class I/II-fold pyridoxal phosphate-dependent enzyme n=1 Tax=Poritiphilus flavus TaxID=2697053 RepID=A0A6L9E9T4_9FLAO|nr:aminotransferase class I/II-fold pyridoxal phosphate-dependent enzyme [Poritiphilus flavus]NAS11557.1 aminotransferase class I/II-fold pyridoxal phosphate-dependent enzyme [Poritiphilus flavus]